MSTTNEKLDELINLTTTMKEQVKGIGEDVTQLNKYVFVGNGKSSLIDRVGTIEVLIEENTLFRRAAIAGLFTSLVSTGVLIITLMQ